MKEARTEQKKIESNIQSMKCKMYGKVNNHRQNYAALGEVNQSCFLEHDECLRTAGISQQQIVGTLETKLMEGRERQKS